MFRRPLNIRGIKLHTIKRTLHEFLSSYVQNSYTASILVTLQVIPHLHCETTKALATTCGERRYKKYNTQYGLPESANSLMWITYASSFIFPLAMKPKINKGHENLPLAEGFFVWSRQTLCNVVVENRELHMSPLLQPESTQRPKVETSSTVLFPRYNVQSKVRSAHAGTDNATAQQAFFKEKEASTTG